MRTDLFAPDAWKNSEEGEGEDGEAEDQPGHQNVGFNWGVHGVVESGSSIGAERLVQAAHRQAGC